MNHLKKILFPVLVIVLFFNCYASQDRFPEGILARFTESAIRVDGRLKEAVWKIPGNSHFTQSEPEDGGRPTEKTEVLIAFDRNFLYVAARLSDSQPDKIAARLGRRDDFVDSDWFIFSVDPYLDRRSGYKFAVNPAGSICDWMLYNDEQEDLTWDGVWESKARITDSGWTVEMSIPFHQLRFKKKDTYTWGVNFHRIIKRKNEENMLAWVAKEDSGYVSRFRLLVGLRNIDPGSKVDLAPYGMSKLALAPSEPGNPFETGSDFFFNGGIDMKLGLRSNLTLDATINPDFGQVEVDPAVINISDRETYYAEKRPFFIEGAGIFRFGEGGVNRMRSFGWQTPGLFYSRRIGRSPRGLAGTEGYVKYPEWTTILGAAKVTGKIGNGLNVGILSALTQRECAEIDVAGERLFEEVEPFTHYGIIRLQKEFHQGRQGLGMIATTVNRHLDSENLSDFFLKNALALGIDGWTFLDRDKAWVVSGWFSTTKVTGSETAVTELQQSPLHYFQRPDADYLSMDETATSMTGWAGRIFFNKQKGKLVLNAACGAISPGFEANEIGFHHRGDTINGHLEFGYQVFHPGKIFRRWQLTFANYRNYDFGGTRIGETYYLVGQAQFLNYWNAGLTFSYEPEKLSHYFTRGGPMAIYLSGQDVSCSISSDNRKSLILSLDGHYRTHPNGAKNWSIYCGLRWKPKSNFSISVIPGYYFRHSTFQWVTRVEDSLKVETFGVRYIFSDIIQEVIPIEIRVNWTFTPRLSFQAYIQPYIAVGDYFGFKELSAPNTFDFNFFDRGQADISYRDGTYQADPDGPGPAAPFSFANPDFNYKSLRGTVVLRWEYRPGSTFYFVWTQNRADYNHPGELSFGRDIGDLFAAPGDNIFLLKFTYRFRL
ncbi:MAG: carbohydrate binding family 9 domain-containing protein [Candidatus Aminicenantes bacterium]|nr:carbohydrate binding family 9 domain-containing protein [Candidatus Aminicenantes bacterium]